MAATDRDRELFTDARGLYDDPLEMVDRNRIRNAAEKAWGATRGATDALIPALEGDEPQSAGQARRTLLRLSATSFAFETLQGPYHTRSALLHVNCFYDGNCEPEVEMENLIRTTIDYIIDAETLAATS